jgi:hypothetical protein
MKITPFIVYPKSPFMNCSPEKVFIPVSEDGIISICLCERSGLL